MQRGFAPIIILVGILILAGIAGGGYYLKVKTPAQKACTLEAKICPDGSSVGRSGPNCVFAPCSSPKNSDYERVTIKQLIGNKDKFNDKKVVVKGKFQRLSMARVMCVPIGDGTNPQIKEGYRVYPTTWAIVDATDTLGVYVTGNSSLPNYKEGQEIQLQGIAKAGTVPDSCLKDILYRSIYLEVKAEDIDITINSKPSPETLPDLK